MVGLINGNTEDIFKSIPEYIRISLINNLYALCSVYKEHDYYNLQVMCYVISDNRLYNEDIQFNVTQITNDEKNIIINGLIDY